MIEPLTTKEFIERCVAIHGNQCDYSKVEYLSQSKKVCIICNQCRTQYWQLPQNHYRGIGCPTCRYKRTAENNTKDLHDFVKDATSIHDGKYTYHKVKYEGSRKKVVITCPYHGDFCQLPPDHLSGKGCNLCGNESIGASLTSTTFDFKQKAMTVHGNRYSYNLTQYTKAKSKVTITCPDHGNFRQSATNHLQGAGCPKCSQSKGEKAVADYLSSMGIQYEQEKSFPECRDKAPLRFDFYFEIQSIHFLVEYQGIHHYEAISFFEQQGRVKYEWYKRHDEIKRNFAKTYGFSIIEVPYTERNIDTYLSTKISQYLESPLPFLHPTQLHLFE